MVKQKRKITLRSLYYNRALRLSVLTGLSSAFAYVIATIFPLADPTVAAITGLVAISPTFHNSVKSAFAEMAGVLLGSVVGLFFINWLGFNVLTLGILIVTAYLLAWGLRLGETAAVPIGVTMVLVCGPLLDNVVGLEGRVLGVLIGAGCALIASYFVLPGTPHERALKDIRKESLQAAQLLFTVARSLSEGSTTAVMSHGWLKQSQGLTERSREYMEEAKDAVKGSKWSPMLSKKETTKVLKQVRNLNNIVSAVNNICEDLNSFMVQDKKLTPEFRESLSQLLITTAENIVIELEEADSKTGRIILDSSLQNKNRETIETIKNIDETQAIMLGGGIVRDASKIRDSLK